MKIEKIKNYNQKLLALLGTVVFMMAVIGLIFIIIGVISEFNNFFRNDNPEGILSADKIEELQKDNKRLQFISLNFPNLVDTTNLIYVIPVGQRTLDKPVEIEGEILNMSNDNFQSVLKESFGRYSEYDYGYFNNLIIYDHLNETTKTLFDNRLSFSLIETRYFKDEILVLLKAADIDSNKDQIINEGDFKSLYIYSITQKKLTQVRIENHDIMKYRFVEDTKNMILSFGIDKNNDGKYDPNREPTIIKKYKYPSGQLQDIVSIETVNKLQKLLDGSKK